MHNIITSFRTMAVATAVLISFMQQSAWSRDRPPRGGDKEQNAPEESVTIDKVVFSEENGIFKFTEYNPSNNRKYGQKIRKVTYIRPSAIVSMELDVIKDNPYLIITTENNLNQDKVFRILVEDIDDTQRKIDKILSRTDKNLLHGVNPK